MRVALAADLGGTFLRTGLVTSEGTVLHATVRPLEDRRGNTDIGELLGAALGEIYELARRRGMDPVGVGVAIPGLVDPRAGVLRYSGNLEVRDLRVIEIVREAVPLPVVMDNDVRAAAWGEWRWGAGQGSVALLYLSAGTGIAAAMLWAGRPYAGARGAAGELGHAPVVPDGEVCRCGGRGCLETVSGGWGIARRAGRPTAEAVFEAAEVGDAGARAVVADAGKFLGMAMVTAARLWDPDLIVLGGGLLYPRSPLVGAVTDAVRRHVLSGDEPPEVQTAAFGGQAGLIGAGCLALDPPP